jgi:UDP-2,3-diacylglucosamine pyrophosphatase LpxH
MKERTYTPTEIINNLGGSLVETTTNDEALREVTTLSGVDKVVQVSDVHLGHEPDLANFEGIHNPFEFQTFVNEEVRRINPDLFIISGDFLEFWRSSIETVLTRFRDIISDVLSLSDVMEVALVPGNHDYRLVKLDSELIVSEGIRFKSGNVEFKVIHGHNYDPRNSNNYTNEGLCLTSTETGSAADKYWKVIKKILPAGVSYNRFRYGFPDAVAPLGTIQHLSNPDVLSEKPYTKRARAIRNGIEISNDEYMLYGHTHKPYVGEQSANAGSFTSDTLNYIVVDDGEVELREY